jgi:hypothetical protein
MTLPAAGARVGAGRPIATLPGSAAGPLALGDYDGDGDLDLFVGGRAIPGRYPEAAASVLLRNDQGTFAADSPSATMLATAGLVSGASFADIDADGDADLLLAREWDTILLLVEGWERQQFMAHYGKYIVLDDVEMDDETDAWQVITVQGADAEAELTRRGLPIPGPIHVTTGPEGQPVRGFSWAQGDIGVGRRDRTGRGGFDAGLLLDLMP